MVILIILVNNTAGVCCFTNWRGIVSDVAFYLTKMDY
jgi:hypothetical protein